MANLPPFPIDPVTVAYHQDRPYSFGSEKNVQNQFRGQFNAQEVREQLQKSTAYTRFRPYRKRKDSIPIYAYRKRQHIQCDVCYIDRTDEGKAKNQRKVGVVVFIDVFTKWVWVTPVASVNARTIVNAFDTDFLPHCHPRPENITTDLGPEFNNKLFIAACARERIPLHFGQAKPSRKCAVVERFNRTLQDILHKQMVAFNTNGEWLNILPQTLTIYLNRKHRSIGMSPHQAEQNVNQERLLARHLKRYEKAGRPRKPKFKPNDYVHALVDMTKLGQRGYHPRFSEEVFQVAQVLPNLPRVRYWLRDSKGAVVTWASKITGQPDKPPITWFENELSRYNPPRQTVPR